MAGGTGGHVFPALAVAQQLRAQGVEVLWMGTRNGFEARAVPAAGIEMAWIEVGGLRGKSLMTLLMAPWRILRALWQAHRVILRFRPKLVLGMGGYVAGPGGLAASMLRVPLVIHEQNAAPGTTNKLLARLASHVLQAYPDAFAASDRTQTVGNPVREALIGLPTPAERESGRHEPLRILILGGSGGALTLNRTVPASLARVTQPLELRHQAGRTLAAAQQAYADAGMAHPHSVVEFIDDMAEALSWADLMICRAGALTLAEIAAVGVASILVPFPHAIDDHQTRNAEHLVRAGAAVLMPESELSPDVLARLVETLAADRARLADMAAAARRCAHPLATTRIADVCRPYLGLPRQLEGVAA